MNELEQKKKASLLVLKTMLKLRKENINPYIIIGTFIDEVIKDLSRQNEDEKIAMFLENIAEKVRQGVYRKKKD